MAKRQTPIQKLVTFAMEVTEDELNNVIQVVQAIKSARFPAQPKRKARVDAGKKREPKPLVATDGDSRPVE